MGPPEEETGDQGPNIEMQAPLPCDSLFHTLNRLPGQPHPKGLYTCFIHERTHFPQKDLHLLHSCNYFLRSSWNLWLYLNLKIWTFITKRCFNFLWKLLQRPDYSSAKTKTLNLCEGDSVSNIPSKLGYAIVQTHPQRLHDVSRAVRSQKTCFRSSIGSKMPRRAFKIVEGLETILCQVRIKWMGLFS